MKNIVFRVSDKPMTETSVGSRVSRNGSAPSFAERDMNSRPVKGLTLKGTTVAGFPALRFSDYQAANVKLDRIYVHSGKRLYTIDLFMDTQKPAEPALKLFDQFLSTVRFRG